MVRVILSLLLISSPVFAEECKVPTDVTTPCAGVLLPTTAATLGLTCLKVKVPELRVELEREKALCATDKKLLLGQLDLEKKRNQKLVDLLTDKEPVEPAKSFLGSRTFWLSAGVVTGVTLTLSILKIATATLD